MKFKSIFLSKAVPGMTLARDILDFSGHILVARDTILTDKIITKLQFYSIQNLTVRIDEQGNITTDAVPMDSISQESHLSNIRDTEEYAQFQKKFYGCVEYFQNYLNNVIHNDAPIDAANLLHFTNDILETSRNMIHLFDMLNCMRNYDDNTYTHCVNVALICHVFGNWIKLPQEELEVLTLCGLFHDIGKLEIPQSIIMKPDKLTEDEYNVVKKHTLIGYELLKDKNIDERIKTAALMHHERLDGSGYPHQLNSTSIENFARIVSIADVYDALTSKRVYRDPLCPFEVLHIFEQEGYTKYDPAYLVVFFEQMFQTYVMNTVRLSDGSEGMIIMLNKHSLASPVVQVGNKFIDLSKNKSLSIQAII